MKDRTRVDDTTIERRLTCERYERRRFLVQLGTVAAGSLALGRLTACGGATGQLPASGPVPAGNVANVAVGSLTTVANQPVVIGRDARGLFAMSTICPHEACNIRNDGSISASGLVCDCHGATFDGNGGVTGGPATRGLDHYSIDLAANGEITIQASQIVDAATRVVIP